MRDYGKIHTAFWNWAQAHKVSDTGRLLALYLLSSQHTNMIGCFRLPDGYVAEDLGWTLERVAKGFTELFEKGFAKRCETTKWVFVAKFLKWNEIENPNQAKAAAKLFSQIPDLSGLKPAIAQVFDEFAPRIDRALYRDFLEVAANPFERVSKPGTGAGAETEDLRTFSASGDAAGTQGEEIEGEDSCIFTRRKRKLTGKRLSSFLEFWSAFDYKRGRAEAADAWLDIPMLKDSLVARIVDAARREAQARPTQVNAGHTPKMAQGWLSARRWEDETCPLEKGTAAPVTSPISPKEATALRRALEHHAD